MNFFNIDKSIADAAEKVIGSLSGTFARIDGITEHNQQKVLAAFIKNKVSEPMFAASTGYGYGDSGRETLDKALADALGAEDALIRHSFTCGTHTLAVMLFGVLRPGDTMLCVTGTPYDTIHSVIGLRGEGQGSLRDFGINYKQTELDAEGKPDLDAIKDALRSDKSIKAVYTQRSRGYTLRGSLSVETIGKITEAVKASGDALVLVDNCYGEFVEKDEPLAVGADLIAGSLIKNAGGGIAPTGGYIAGKKELVELCAYRATTPGLGREVGATLGHSRELFMGLFNA
ncbi:MAG: hypothetical protein GX851_04115, partial [Clostridiales bacterium]|nr:hypothetical protein [Clostridiales bacterium]